MSESTVLTPTAPPVRDQTAAPTMGARVWAQLGERPRLVRTASVLSLITAWQAGAMTGLLDERFYSSPTAVAAAGVELFTGTDMLPHVLTTGTELLVGYGLGVVAAVLVGFVLGYYRVIGTLADPVVMALYVTPRLAIYPVLVIWFGLGLGSKIVMVFLGTFFMVLINTISGVRDVDPSLIRAARSFMAPRSFILRKVVIPGAVPSIMTGLRQGFSQAIIAVITAEMFVSLSGMGNLISTYGQAMRTDALLFLVLLVSSFAYVAIRGLSLVERRLSSWRPS
jgi:ABC-type nitrate/sulfonate/bicarbonate transport system permease component